MKKKVFWSLLAALLLPVAVVLVPSCAKSALPEAEGSSTQTALPEDEEGPDDDAFEVTAEIALPEQDDPQASISKISYTVASGVLKANWAVGDTIFGYWMNGSTKNYISYKVSSLNASTGKARFTKLSGTNPGSGKTFYMFYAPRTSWYNQIMSSKLSGLTVDLRYQSYDGSSFSSGTYSGKLPTIMTSVATSTSNGVVFTFMHRTSVLGLVTPSLSNSGSSEKVYQLIMECTGLYTAGTYTPNTSTGVINFSDDSSTRGAIWLDCSNLTAGTCSSKIIFFVLFNGGTSGKMTMTARTPAARYYNVSKPYKSTTAGYYYQMSSLNYNERWVIPSDCVDLGLKKVGRSNYYMPLYWRNRNFFFKEYDPSATTESASVNNYGDYFQWGLSNDWHPILYSSLPTNKYSNGNTLTVTMKSDNNNVYFDPYRFPFGWSSDHSGSGLQISSYVYSTTYAYQGTLDKTPVLRLTDDVAYVGLGSTKYMTPQLEHWQSLKEQTYCVWTSSYNGSGRQGCIIYEAKRHVDRGQWSESTAAPSGLTYTLSDRHIFLPAAGRITDSNQMNSQILNCFYWTSSLYLPVAESYSAYYFSVVNNDPSTVSYEASWRCSGLPVRPIYVPTDKSN